MKIVKQFLYSFVLIAFVASCSNAQNKQSTVENINVEQFSKIIENKDIIVIDVRTDQEVSQGKIENAVNIDFFNSEFASEIDKLDKSKTYAVYCKVGGRSGKAAKLMEDKGFSKVYNLNGGFDAWSSMKKPIVKE